MPEENPKLVHGSNLSRKEQRKTNTKYQDSKSRAFLREIRPRYDAWRRANMDLKGPFSKKSQGDGALIAKRVELLTAYKNFLDLQKYAEKFDSRSNLHSSVLEEFMYYLFKDLVADFGKHALIGKSHSFKDIFFTPPNYKGMLDRPYARIERKDHDFVIGATYIAHLDASTPLEEDRGGQIEVKVEKKPEEYEQVAVTPSSPYAPSDEAESHAFDIPAVAIECKTYLDKTMLEGSSRAAQEIKARNPNGLYIVVMEWLKLTENVNLRKFKVDQIYVLRKQKNTDREFRYDTDYDKKPIDSAVVEHLFNTVRFHLTEKWGGSVASGLNRGWLIGA